MASNRPVFRFGEQENNKVSAPEAYPLPTGQLALSGPIAKPAPGTLPLRGDIAHIALANRYLVPHYVVPQPRKIAAGGAKLLLSNNDSSDVLAELAAGDMIEALDFAGDWCWCCLGPEGPTGYIRSAQLAPVG